LQLQTLVLAAFFSLPKESPEAILFVAFSVHAAAEVLHGMINSFGRICEF
jgi:hypothetical protein